MNMAYIRAKAKQKQIDSIRERIISDFANNPNGKHRVIQKVARSVILNGPYLLNGEMWDVKSRSLGAGVHELRLVKLNLPDP